MTKIDNRDDTFVTLDEIKESVISDAVSIKAFEIVSEFFDIGTEIGIFA